MNLPTLSELQGFVTNIEAAVSTFKNAKASGLEKMESVLPVASSVLDALFPGLSIAGIGVTKALGVVKNLSDEEPEITTAFNNIKAVASGGTALTDAQWMAFNAAADKAHTDFQAAVADYLAS